MAAPKSSGVLKSLEEEVNCPLCLEVFTDPKRLPCEHVFCMLCLERLVQKAPRGVLTCPVCRDVVPLQEGRLVSQFTTAHQVNRLIDIYHKTLKDRVVDAAPGQHQIPATCSLHATQPLLLFCESCVKLVCRDCVSTSCEENNHEYGFVNEMAKKYLKELDSELQPIRELQQSLKDSQRAVVATNNSIESKESLEISRIEESFSTLTNILEKEKYSIISAVRSHFGQQKARNELKQDKLSGILHKLNTFLHSADNISSDVVVPNICQEVIAKKKDGEVLVQQYEGLSWQPVQPLGLKVRLPGAHELEGLFQQQVVYNHLMAKGAVVNKPFQTTVHIEPVHKFSEIKSELVCTYDSSSQPVRVTRVSSETFSFAVTPKKRGKHELHIQCNGAPLCGSPIALDVYIPPQDMFLSVKKTFQKTLHNPRGIKCHEGKIFVVEEGKGITFIANAETCMTTGTTIATGINGEVLIHDGHVYLSDQTNNKVVKMDMNGAVLKSIGGRGTRLGAFRFPNGIRMSKRKHIYVCDSNNHRIQIFDTHLNFLRSLGKKGTNQGEFDSPTDLDIDEDGNLYVVEQCNHRVQVLTEHGEHLRFIGDLTSLNNPTSAAIYNGHIFVVSFGSHSISVFTLQGHAVTRFGGNVLVKPECIAIDDNGFVFVTDNNCTLLRF